MGVKHFWDIVDEAKSIESLDCLRGKVLSVDLSIWIVEAIKTLRFQTSVIKPHLRIIFYRILFLRKLGAKLIFVTEGDPPDLKQDTMKQRIKEQYGTCSKKKIGRSKFQNVINECCEMLDYLGLPYVKATGEAEAMCAVLNRLNLSDGCLTNDSDFFLYGGKVIYRDFGIDSKDQHVLKYTSENIRVRCGLTREDLVGLALLCGCDYTSGVPGVGKGVIKKFLEERTFQESLMQRFSKWASSSHEHDKSVFSSELKILRKAEKVENFFNGKVVEEFLIDKDLTCQDVIIATRKKLFWRYPCIERIQKFFLTKLEWPVDYTLNKVMQLAANTYLEKLFDNTFYKVPIQPSKVLKRRCQKGVALVELEWIKIDDEATTHGERWQNCPDIFQTLESQAVVVKVLPGLVDEFSSRNEKSERKKKPWKEESVKRIATQSCIDIGNLTIGGFTKTDLSATSKVISRVNDEKFQDDLSVDEQEILPLYQRLTLKLQERNTNKESIRDEKSLRKELENSKHPQYGVHDEESLRKEIENSKHSQYGVYDEKSLRKRLDTSVHTQDGVDDEQRLIKRLDTSVHSQDDVDDEQRLRQRLDTSVHSQDDVHETKDTPRSLNVTLGGTPICQNLETPNLVSHSQIFNMHVKKRISTDSTNELNFSNLGDSILSLSLEEHVNTNANANEQQPDTNQSFHLLDDSSPLSLVDRLRSRFNESRIGLLNQKDISLP